jgi:hypothetical protein
MVEDAVSDGKDLRAMRIHSNCQLAIVNDSRQFPTAVGDIPDF